MGHADDLLSSHDSFSYCDFARVRCDTVAKHVAAVEGFFSSLFGLKSLKDLFLSSTPFGRYSY